MNSEQKVGKEFANKTLTKHYQVNKKINHRGKDHEHKKEYR